MGVEERPDFETLSAFVDNELDASGMERVRAWIARDSGVECEVDALRALKARVAGMSLNAQRSRDRPRDKAHKRAAIAFAAASLVLGLIALGGYRMDFAIPVDGERSVSEQLVATYDDWNPDHRVAVQAPMHAIELFRRAGLSLKVQEALHLAGNEVFHSSYVGNGGCRISIFEFPNDAVDPHEISELIRLDEDALSTGWKSPRSSYVMVARRMDAKRFAAIATALQDLVPEDAGLIVAETDIPRSSCLG